MNTTSILREPLAHFFAGGALLFVLYGFVSGDDLGPPDEIIVDDTQLDILLTSFTRTWQRPPTEEELQGLVDTWIREEIFYREGMALRLDEGDPVVRRRVAQKVEFIAEGLVGSGTETAELQLWLDEHPEDYRLPTAYSLRQVFFDPRRHGDSLADLLDSTLAGFTSGTITEAGDPTMLPARIDGMAEDVIGRVFGTGFAASLGDLQPATWSGPVLSDFGVHLVFIEDVVPGRIPALDEVRAQVERDILRTRTEESNRAFYQSLRDKYTITITAELLVPGGEQ